jgi:hypothetical protein
MHMRARTLVIFAALAGLALRPAPAQAGCGCSKPPPAPATVRPGVAYPGTPITLFSSYFQPGILSGDY